MPSRACPVKPSRSRGRRLPAEAGPAASRNRRSGAPATSHPISFSDPNASTIMGLRVGRPPLSGSGALPRRHRPETRRNPSSKPARPNPVTLSDLVRFSGHLSYLGVDAGLLGTSVLPSIRSSSPGPLALLPGNGGKHSLTITRYWEAMCDRGNPCARRHESAAAGRAGRGSRGIRGIGGQR
jgi:hypothetical protein